jgi:pimeloyl-ACP methyl ester carboxylesterase
MVHQKLQRLVLVILGLAVLVACGGRSQTIDTTAGPAPSSVPAAPTSASIAPSAVSPAGSATAEALPAGLSRGIDGFSGKVDVGGRKLYLLCLGSGSPTIVLDAGLTRTSDDWAKVQIALKEVTRVCAYDRANLGQSDSAPKPRTSQDMVADLHSLLVNAKLAEPYVLVGHSGAGFNILLYAHQYPAEVAGAVLIESSHPDQNSRTLAILGPERASDPQSVKDMRNFTNEQESHTSLPDDPEGLNWKASVAQVRPIHSLGALPLLVITAGKSIKTDAPDMPDALATKLDQDWFAMQKELAGLSSNSTSITVPDAGHCVQCDKPDVVTQAIGALLEQVRK